MLCSSAPIGRISSRRQTPGSEILKKELSAMSVPLMIEIPVVKEILDLDRIEMIADECPL
jgi:hypothetical protein